ncbi:hypothetical protein [Kangiella spongicola]|uniref:Uncharacterized protein n=1 Tax=Kangiella spongicola TaxID=796379 RepID=A0A318D2B8_9GAMM|nr:hypothetical protein [Kangiella spongicola]MBV35902.1 hypothetical protein [Rickettsiales bacterium]PXF63121.1 hypothetical protein DL796_06645 [Kangiella spongicola]
MKLFGLTAASILLTLSLGAQAEGEATQGANSQQAGMEAMMMQMMKQEMAKTCQDKEMLSCIEISESDCNAMMTGILDKCMAPNFSQLMAAQGMSQEERDALSAEMENCSKSVSEEHGIDPEKAQSCSSNK